MWKIERIEIENIVSFRDAYLDITPDVATLIFGRNEDNASQPCNGSGKSSLIEAISFALTGEQLRKVKSVEEIINDNCDTASVFMRLCNDYFRCTFEIRRTISRSSSQVVECHKFSYEGDEIDQDVTVQPTVADYNKYILSEIGLTKEQLYNIFILCDNKYESFFDASDKNKKEIINRFSNGELVDESIARVQADMEPIAEEVRDLEGLYNRRDGAVQATRDAIDKADEKDLANKEERERQIAEYERKVVECREAIDRSKSQIVMAIERIGDLKDLQISFKSLEETGASLTDGYEVISKALQDHGVQGLNDYMFESKEMNGQLTECEGLLKEYNNRLAKARNVVDETKKLYADKSSHLIEHEGKHALWLKVTEEALVKHDAKMRKVQDLMNILDRQLTEMETKNDRLKGAVANARRMIEGAVTCPNCKHRFILADDSSVKEYEKKVEGLEKDMEDNKAEYNKVADRYDELQVALELSKSQNTKLKESYDAYNKDVEECKKNLNLIQFEISNSERSAMDIETKLNQIKVSIDKITGKIDLLRDKMFTQADQLLETKIASGIEYVNNANNAISYNEGLIETYRKNKAALENQPASSLKEALEKTLEEQMAAWSETHEKLFKKKDELFLLKGQELSFILFKSYLARKKIDALSLVVNDFLEKIGSDIRLRLEGFSVTKTGKLRDKISVNVMRDGVDCGSFQKFSGGEKARLNLACILSLHTLTNSNCENGRGLDFLIIDELLDKSDEVGMATYCEALNRLKQTALLITQGAVAEGYPYKLLITKSKGVSTISY